MKTKKFISAFAAIIFAITAALSVPAKTGETKRAAEVNSSAAVRVRVPLNLAVLVQDDLVARVGNELDLTRDFIRSLPEGSRVMVGYLTTGSLQVRQPFTTDLEKAARSLRVPLSSEASAPYNPYVEVKEALRKFDAEGPNRNAVLLISDGLDTSRGFDFSSSVQSVDLMGAIREAKKRNVTVYTFYAPTVGLTSWNRTAVNFGQSALNRLADETGGEAFFQGLSFVTFDSYFKRLGRSINEQFGATS